MDNNQCTNKRSQQLPAIKNTTDAVKTLYTILRTISQGSRGPVYQQVICHTYISKVYCKTINGIAHHHINSVGGIWACRHDVWSCRVDVAGTHFMVAAWLEFITDIFSRHQSSRVALLLMSWLRRRYLWWSRAKRQPRKKCQRQRRYDFTLRVHMPDAANTDDALVVDTTDGFTIEV